MSSIRDQIAAKRAQAPAQQQRVQRSAGQTGSGSTLGSSSGFGTRDQVVEDRTVHGQIRKGHKSGKLDISSFDLDEIPSEVYIRLLCIPISELSNPPKAGPSSSTSTAPIIPRGIGSGSQTNGDSGSSRGGPSGDSREAVFGQKVAEKDWGEPQELISFGASHNRITGVEREIGAFGGLKSIDLSYNQLTALPRSFSDLLRLVTIDLSYNQLSSIPPTLLLLPVLQTLDLSHNLINTTDLSDPVTPSDEGLAYGAGFLTTSFGRSPSTSKPLLPALKSLNLSHNHLTSESLSGLKVSGNMLAIETLDLSGNRLSGILDLDGTSTFGKASMPNLRTLNLSHNKALKSVNGSRAEELQIDMEGCNIVTNSTLSPSSENSDPTAKLGAISLESGSGSGGSKPDLPVPSPDMTIIYRSCPAATFDSEPLNIAFDIYLPSSPASPSGHPLLIWFHGGGLLQGNKENLVPHLRRLPSRSLAPPSTSTSTSNSGKGENVVVISPNYRLAPQVPILDIFDDIDALLIYIRTKLNDRLKKEGKEDHLVDVSRICLSGGSAGGYLALMAGVKIDNKRIQDVDVGGYRGVDRGNTEGIRCIAPFYPITDLTHEFWSTKTDPVPWYGRSVAHSEAQPHLDLKAAPIATAKSGGPRSILYMYMLQHALFPSLLFLRQKSVGNGLDGFRPEPKTLSIPHRCDLLSKHPSTSPRIAYSGGKIPVYLTYGTIDRAIQPLDESIESLKPVCDLEVEVMEGLDHGFDEEPSVECPKFVEWLTRTLL